MANSLQAQIPVIDISHDNVEAPRQLLDAATKFGFIYIANDKGAIDPGLIAAMFALSREFFASPVDVKESVSIRSNQAGKNHGWLSQGVEKLDPAGQKQPDVKEAFNMAEPIHHRPQQPLTPLLTARLPLLLDFHAACRALCSAVLEHLATALGIPADWFASRHDPDGGPSGSVLRMLYYPGARGPPADDDDDEARGDIRAGAHSDFGSITCLFQLPGQPGLEILTPEGEWAAVAVDPDPLAPSASSPPSESPSPSELSAAAAPSPSSTTATTAAATAPRGRRNLPILVNIGDLLEEWTGGLLKSTRHRVVFPSPAPSPSSSHPGEASGSSSSDRYSLAYFCHPLDDAALEPVPSRLVQEHIASSSRTEAATTTATTTTAKRAVITAKDHLARRLAETYTIPTASP